MRQTADERRDTRPGRQPGAPVLYLEAVLALLIGLGLGLVPGAAWAEEPENPFAFGTTPSIVQLVDEDEAEPEDEIPDLAFESLPELLRYSDEDEKEMEEDQLRLVVSRRMIPNRADQLHAEFAPTRYRVDSIFKYQMSLGDSGMLLRVKIRPLKPRKAFRVELRF